MYGNILKGKAIKIYLILVQKIVFFIYQKSLPRTNETSTFTEQRQNQINI